MMEEYEKRESPENAEFLGWHTRIDIVLKGNLRRIIKE